MADLKKTVELIFGGVDNTGGAISSVGRGLDSLVDKTGNVTGFLADITDSIVKLDLALAAAGVGITAFAVKLSDDFDTAFGEIATLIGQPADNLRDFQAQILEYSERSTASLDQITSATYGAISAGVDYQNSLELIAAAEQLAIAGKADLGDTTTALVSTMNAFGASADEAGAYADTFFTTVQLGQTTIPELSSSIGRLAPVANAAGLSFDEMAAAIATITASTGLSTAETITGIAASINAIISPSKQASDLAEELGLEFNATALAAKGYAGFLEEMADKTGGSIEATSRLLGNKQALVPVLSLTGAAAESFADNMSKYEVNAGAASTASKELINTLGNLGQTLRNNVESALIGLGARLTDETRSSVKSITSIFNSLGDEIKLEDGAFAPILDGLEGLAQDIDRKLQVIAQNFPEALSGLDLTGLLSAFGDLGDELGDLFTGLFGNVDLSTVEGLQAAMQRVVDAFTALVQISAGIADGLQPLFRAIGRGIEEFEKLDDSTMRSIGEILGLGKAIDTVLPAIGGLAGGLESIGTGLTALAGAQGFKALLGNLESVRTIASGAGRFGLVGAALIGSAGAGYGIGTLLNEYIIGPLEDYFGNSIGGWLYDLLNADEIAKLEAEFNGFGNQVEATARETEELRRLNDRLADSLDNTKQAAELDIDALNKRAAELVENANQQRLLNDSLSGYSGNQRDATTAIEELTDAVSESGGALGEISRTTKELSDNNRSLQLGYDETTGKINSFSGTIVKSGKSIDDTAKKTEELVKQSEAYQLKLLDIASNERIAVIESKVKLDIAEVEANAQRVEAIAKTISDTFESTGSVITDLFGGFDDASRTTQIELSKQIREEQAMRKQALDDQSKLTQAEVDYIRQKTRALQRGDAMIKVDGAGLQPHLEAFMFEILREIQVRVNADGEEMLLGLRP
ncbi:phage tail tape measure protein [Marinobacter shengliensis]|uniref:phage tail tape measure protein n=1 Tax=Marinobacter shengliensis TaxID=1389223 RepID=UPI001E5C030F|nr:phage tail tape measure protein [Marinobacter shengliensis]MCD1631346.1 phage tail tape measure protein [Marinobacter shengliensis]